MSRRNPTERLHQRTRRQISGRTYPSGTTSWAKLEATANLLLIDIERAEDVRREQQRRALLK